MNKKILITLITAGTLIVLLFVAWNYLYFGTLTITTNPASANVVIDGGKYQGTGPLTQKLRPGMHQIDVGADLYGTKGTNAQVGLWAHNTLDVSLDASADAKAVIENSQKATNLWVSYSRDKKTEPFLLGMKALVASDIYDSLAQMIDLASIQTRPDVINVQPMVAGPIKTAALVRTSESGVQATVVTTRTSDDNSTSSLVFAFTKQTGGWVIEDITYNY